MESPSVVTQQPSMEGKILIASTQASKVADIFSPAAAEAIQAGVAVEPVISHLIKLIAGLFHHHTGTRHK